MTEKNKSGIDIYRRLLSHVVPYWKVFIFSVFGMAVYSITDAAFAMLMKPLLDDGFVKQDPTIIVWLPIIDFYIYDTNDFWFYIYLFHEFSCT